MRYRVNIQLLGGDDVDTWIDAPNPRVAVEWVLLAKSELLDEFVPSLERTPTVAFANGADGSTTELTIRARMETTFIVETKP